MADLSQALVTRLLADTGLAAAVDDRIHWSIVPQDTPLPYIRLQVVSDHEDTDIKGRPLPHDARVQMDCFAMSYGETRMLAKLVKAALREPAQVAGVQFGRAQFAGPRDGGEDGDGSWVHRASLDCALWHQVIG